MQDKQALIDFPMLRADFPILAGTNRGKPFIYLDSASSAQKPKQVIDTMAHFYLHDYANVHRGIYELSERATCLYENVRKEVKDFINAKSVDEIIFVSSTTAGINLIAQSFSHDWKSGDEVILSEMEHHSNIVPWYLLKQRLGIEIKVIPVNDDGSLDLMAYKKLFSARTKLVAITHASNVMGTINPVKEMAALAHKHQVPIMLDGAQAIAHMPVDVLDLDCDFYIFSAHKLYGPTGIGVLYGKAALLQAMPPYQGGGGMIETVAFEKVTFAKIPAKFEAGTLDIGGVIGLGAAIRYLNTIGTNVIYQHEQGLLAYAEKKLAAIDGLKMLGTAKPKVGVMSFVIDSIHPHDVGTVLDHEGVAIRAGHHCAMPLMTRFGLPAVARASLGLYNNEEDIDALIEAVLLAKRLFA